MAQEITSIPYRLSEPSETLSFCDLHGVDLVEPWDKNGVTVQQR
jgi:hypothetical protein